MARSLGAPVIEPPGNNADMIADSDTFGFRFPTTSVTM